MSEPTLKCRHTGQQVPYQILQGLAPIYVFQLSEQWDTEKRQIMRQLIADFPAAAEDPNVLFDQLPAYGLSDFHWSWLDKAFAFRSDDYHWFFLIAQGRIQPHDHGLHPFRYW